MRAIFSAGNAAAGYICTVLIESAKTGSAELPGFAFLPTAQAALLAGNSGEKKYLPVLEAWSQLPFEAVAEHARWARERLLTVGLDRKEKTD